MAKILYCVPGLGTDERVFSQLLPLLDWAGEVQVLNYLEPVHRRESLEEYAARLRAILPTTWDEPPTIIGMSLGGMVAAELAQLMPYAKLILISTVKQRREQPAYFKILRFLPLYRLLPPNFAKRFGPALARRLGTFEAEYLEITFEMFRAKSDAHFAWGRRVAIRWRGQTELLPRTWHLHGTRDHIFAHKRIKNADFIDGGSHNMILERAQTVADWVNNILKKA
jgi:pimeloyl-ACP methyl ester carboxylesterase